MPTPDAPPKMVTMPADQKLALEHELLRLAGMFPDVALVVFTADRPPMSFDELKAFFASADEHFTTKAAVDRAAAEGKLA